MKVLQINTVFRNGGSTGRIVYDLMQTQMHHGIDAYVAYGYDTGAAYTANTMCLQGWFRRKANIIRTRLFDHHGFYNEEETRRLLKWMDKIHPDIVHLHNIHNHYVHVGRLFDYIKQHNIPVVWTLHDCWPFTGHCAYFDYANCGKWKTGCNNCPSLKDYPPTWFLDRSKRNYEDKKVAFKNVKTLTLVPPSEWLGALLNESFLNDYPVEVINNGIDINLFKPSPSEIKTELGIDGKNVILAVTNGFMKRKGTDYLLKMIPLLHSNEVLVVVGITESEFGYKSDDKCKVVTHTDSVQQLAQYYSAADIFINPTLEDNFPTTNIEALACGTPIVTFRTGGSVESVTQETGLVIEKGDLDGMMYAIRKIIANGKNYYSDCCVNKAKHDYDKETQYLKYIELYKRILHK